eukprot:scaffold26976_cov181-Cylindrotheca_fusiformis.AAC.3
MIPNYSERFGLLIFRKFFDLCPDAIPLFSFGNELTIADDGLEEDDSLGKNPRFMMHIKLFMSRFSATMDMLGPDMEVLEGDLVVFAKHHRQYGVTKEHHRMMEIAIIEAVQTMLGDQLKQEMRKSWEKLGSFIMSVMQKELH